MPQSKKQKIDILNKEFAQGAELLAQGIEQLNTVIETLMEEAHQEDIESQVVEQSNSVIGIIIENVQQEEPELALQGGQSLNNMEEMQV